MGKKIGAGGVAGLIGGHVGPAHSPLSDTTSNEMTVTPYVDAGSVSGTAKYARLPAGMSPKTHPDVSPTAWPARSGMRLIGIGALLCDCPGIIRIERARRFVQKNLRRSKSLAQGRVESYDLTGTAKTSSQHRGRNRA